MIRLWSWIKYNLSNTQTRLVFILTVSVSLIISAVGLTTYYSSKSILQSELSEPQHQSLRIGMNLIDKYIYETHHTAIKVALHPNIYRFLTMEDQGSYENITQLYEFLEALITNQPYVQSIYIYDVKRSSFIAYPQGFSSRVETFTDSGWVSVADRFGEQQMMVENRKIPAGMRDAGSDQVTLYRKIVLQGELTGIIAVNFKNNELLSQIQANLVSSLNSVQYIFDPEGSIIYTTGAIDEGIEPNVLYKGLETLGDHAFGDLIYNDSRLLVSRLDSALTGWKYVSVVSQEQLLEKSAAIRNVVLIVSFAALIIGGLAIFYINSIAFQPVRRMRTMLNAYEKEDSNTDLVFLENITGKLLNDHVKLSQLIRETMPEASSKFLHDAFTGTLTGKKELQSKWNSYFQGWSDAPLAVAVISIDRYGDWSNRFTDRDHVLLKFALANITEEMFSETWRTAVLELGNDKTILLLQPIHGAANEKCRETMQEAAHMIHRLLGFSISIGISDSHAEISRLRLAMNEAENALGYRLYRGYGSVITYPEVAEHEMPDRSMGEDVASNLTAAIEAGSEEHAAKIIGRIESEIRQSYWYPSAAYSYLNLLREKLIKLMNSKEQLVRNEMSEPLHFESMELSEITDKLKELVGRLAVSFSSLTQSKEYMMVQQMIDYMKKHLSDNIGVQDIVGSANISVSLASQLFKQETNETIHDYFTNLRMDRAAELLLETDNKVSDIAIMVGYQHENSFIRVFRKYKDITPGKYRELMRTKEASLS
jgi:AraC-like DNA-binding protein